MGKLSELKIKALKPEDKKKKYSDGEGLYMYVYPNGTKTWVYRYTQEKKQREYTIGKYPIVSTAKARKIAFELAELSFEDKKLSEHKKKQKFLSSINYEDTFEAIALKWIEKQSKIWKTNTKKSNLGRLEKHIFPHIGDKPIKSITRQQLISINNIIEEKEKYHTTHRTCGLITSIFQYAFNIGLIDIDITINLRKCLTPYQAKRLAHIENPEEFALLLQRIDKSNIGIINKMFLQIMPYVFVRSNELCGAEWEEICFKTDTWTIPARRMKRGLIHKVPLAPQVIELLKELQKYTGNNKYLFPAARTKGGHMSTEVALKSLRRVGYSREVMCIHGFRYFASTVLNGMDYNRDWIEVQLAHIDTDRIRGIYNSADYISKRRGMMNDFADYLNELKNNAEISTDT